MTPALIEAAEALCDALEDGIDVAGEKRRLREALAAATPTQDRWAEIDSEIAEIRRMIADTPEDSAVGDGGLSYRIRQLESERDKLPQDGPRTEGERIAYAAGWWAAKGELSPTDPSWLDVQMKDPEFRAHFAVAMAEYRADNPPTPETPTPEQEMCECGHSKAGHFHGLAHCIDGEADDCGCEEYVPHTLTTEADKATKAERQSIWHLLQKRAHELEGAAIDNDATPYESGGPADHVSEEHRHAAEQLRKLMEVLGDGTEEKP